MTFILGVLVVLLTLFSAYLLFRDLREAKAAPKGDAREEFQSDMQYVAGEIKKLYEERAQMLAENDRLKRDLEELRKKLGPSEPPRT